MGKRLTDSALLSEMLALWGTRHTTMMLGVAAMAGVLGVEDREQFLRMPVGSVASRYRWAAEYRALGDLLRAKGYELDDEPSEDGMRIAVVMARATA